jgi:hypothetical protein
MLIQDSYLPLLLIDHLDIVNVLVKKAREQNAHFNEISPRGKVDAPSSPKRTAKKQLGGANGKKAKKAPVAII